MRDVRMLIAALVVPSLVLITTGTVAWLLFRSRPGRGPGTGGDRPPT